MKTKIFLVATVIALGSFAMAAGNGDIGSVENDINAANIRALVLQDTAVKALYTQYSSKNYNKGCTNTEVYKIDLKSMSFSAYKSCTSGDDLGESSYIITIKGVINPYSDSKKLVNIQIKSVQFEMAE